MPVETGDLVQVVDRAPTPADRKSGLFYNHFRNLRGRVDRIYDDGALGVVVDHASLTTDMISRLKRAERLIKPRWKTAGDTTPIPEPEPQPVAAAEDAGDGDEDEAGEDTAEGEEFLPVAAAEPEPVEEAASARLSSGLRYAIVVRAEDVLVLDHGGSEAPAAPGGQPLPAGVRVSEEALKAAEEAHMRKLLERAGAPRKS